MKDILTAPWMVEMIRTATNMYAHGWDECCPSSLRGCIPGRLTVYWFARTLRPASGGSVR